MPASRLMVWTEFVEGRRGCMCQFTGLRLEVGRVNRASRGVKDTRRDLGSRRRTRERRVVEQISGREIFVKNISETGGFAHWSGVLRLRSAGASPLRMTGIRGKHNL